MQVHLAYEPGPIGGSDLANSVVLYARAHDLRNVTVWPEWMPIDWPGDPVGVIDGAWDAQAVEDALRRIGADVISESIAAGDTSLIGLAVEVDLTDHGARRYLPVEVRGLEARSEGPLHEYWRGRGYDVQLELSIEAGHVVVVTVLHPDPGAWYRPEAGHVVTWAPGNIDRSDFLEWLATASGIAWANRLAWGSGDRLDGALDELAARGWSYLRVADFADLDEAPADDPALMVWSLVVQSVAIADRVILIDDPATAAREWRGQHPA